MKCITGTCHNSSVIDTIFQFTISCQSSSKTIAITNQSVTNLACLNRPEAAHRTLQQDHSQQLTGNLPHTV